MNWKNIEGNAWSWEETNGGMKKEKEWWQKRKKSKQGEQVGGNEENKVGQRGRLERKEMRKEIQTTWRKEELKGWIKGRKRKMEGKTAKSGLSE